LLQLHSLKSYWPWRRLQKHLLQLGKGSEWQFVDVGLWFNRNRLFNKQHYTWPSKIAIACSRFSPLNFVSIKTRNIMIEAVHFTKFTTEEFVPIVQIHDIRSKVDSNPVWLSATIHRVNPYKLTLLEASQVR
jgi:hypothetical protein